MLSFGLVSFAIFDEDCTRWVLPPPPSGYRASSEREDVERGMLPRELLQQRRQVAGGGAARCDDTKEQIASLHLMAEPEKQHRRI